LIASLQRNIVLITQPDELTFEKVKDIDPEWIMVPHWRHIIPEQIWSNWSTVIFHMTDLPYGRGGSPLQNLIVRGFSQTMISAIQCSEPLDSGNVYLKMSLSLNGSAEEILLNASSVVQSMIERIVLENPTPLPQVGTPVHFCRRKPEQSNLLDCSEGDMLAWYDHIRMLDAEGYPHAFLEINGMRLEFRRVSRRSDGLHADVVIRSIGDNVLS
tara:strand:+ start:817 stop:1458 length:642 start_codon:yes stop_codon:yes gene_type:complete